MKQKDIFLESEGDNWFHRNKAAVSLRDCSRDAVINMINSTKIRKRSKILEVGCGYPKRLMHLQDLGYVCSGIDPSMKATLSGASRGLKCVQGTAESLPFEDSSFDLLIYGFCLYLCDRNDLFQIASEADRVLKSQGWIIIQDFYSKSHVSVPFSHNSDVTSYKFDNTKMFTWHPHYATFKSETVHHESGEFTDQPLEWVSTSLLRKCQ